MPTDFSSSDLICVIGAGAMGRGIAQIAATAGHPVVVVDSAEAALEIGRQAIAADLASQTAKGRLDKDQADAISARFIWTTDYQALRSAALVVEAIVENHDVKTGVFQQVEAIVAGDTIIATNTSSLSVTALARGLTHPARFAGLHFFNPAPVMKLVEVVAGAATAPSVVTALTNLTRNWRKIAVEVRDVPGFIVNRVARPYYAEGLRAWGEGVASPQAIDHVLKVNGGFRMGPLELGDLIGHDINFATALTVYNAYFGQTRFVPQLAQSDLVAAGRLGRKTKQGVYNHAEKMPEVEFLSCVETENADLSNTVIDAAWSMEIDGVHLQQSDGRSATRLAHDLNKPVAVFDWTRDFASATSLAVAVSDQHHEAALRAAARVAGRFGKKAVVIADRPGMLALRTVCQLANAAADAVRDRVASPKDVDQALVYGSNHPAGPLATSAQIGDAHVVAVLTYIAEETGEPIYSPSEILRRNAWASAQ